jgi:GT2 family glycosyltransferase
MNGMPAVDPPRVSVVVPTSGGRALLARCVASLAAQRFRDFETIVVDNAEAGDPVERRLPRVRVVRSAANDGFAAGANSGAQEAAGAYLAFLNDDVEADPGWLGELVACLERHPRAASVAPKVLRGDDRGVLDGAGDAMTLALKAYRRGQGRRDDGRYDVEEEVFSASGTACLWRAEAFRSLGGFDGSFFAYYEDVDLGFRARRAGFECWYAPRAVAVHRGSATAAPRWREFESGYAVRNRWAAIAKNAPSRWLVCNAHWIVAGELVSLARATLAGDLGLVLRAYADVARSARALRAKRDLGRPEAPYAELLRTVTRGLPPIETSLWRLRASRRLRVVAGRRRGTACA